MKQALHWLLLIVLACFATPAFAHPAPFSFIELHLQENEPHGSLTIHDYDVRHELGLDDSADLSTLESLRPVRERLLALIDARLQLSIDGQRVTPQWGVLEAMPERQSVLLTFALERTMQRDLALEGLLFSYDETHQMFVNIYVDHDLKQQAVLSVDQPRMVYFTGGVQGRLALITTFVQSGIHHIAIGFDHICFLIGLITLGGSLKRLAMIVTAFTISHSVTLTLATLNIVRLPIAPVEALIALSIIVVGVDNMLVLRDRAQGKPVRDIRAPMAGAFGFIHGFGFAAVLAETGLPQGALAWSLAAFNIGVEIGQLIIVVLVLGLGALLTRAGLMRPQLAQMAAWASSIAVTAFGAFWLAQRIGWL